MGVNSTRYNRGLWHTTYTMSQKYDMSDMEFGSSGSGAGNGIAPGISSVPSVVPLHAYLTTWSTMSNLVFPAVADARSCFKILIAYAEDQLCVIDRSKNTSASWIGCGSKKL